MGIGICNGHCIHTLHTGEHHLEERLYSFTSNSTCRSLEVHRNALVAAKVFTNRKRRLQQEVRFTRLDVSPARTATNPLTPILSLRGREREINLERSTARRVMARTGDPKVVDSEVELVLSQVLERHKIMKIASTLFVFGWRFELVYSGIDFFLIIS